MMKNTVAKAILVVTAAAGIGACGGPVAPADPTWTRDIYPLMVARCIRCHDGPPRIDPKFNKPTAWNFNYETLSDPIQPFLSILKDMGPRAVRGEIPGAPNLPNKARMPPP
ncbi:MAG: hypothetical protein H7X95_02190, partial [Deltaproteobacteria bacterium]|nr:hypothetical protein [Deltaproteobacteria bacterium]